MPSLRHAVLAAAGLALFATPLAASDHADPIALPGVMDLFDDGKPDAAAAAKLAGGLTDLFVFPLRENGQLADFPREPNADPKLTAAEQAEIKSFAVILCARRALTKSPPVPLDPYTYSIHFDLRSALAFRGDAEQARYGGTVPEPEKISPDVTIELQLKNDTTLKGHAIRSPGNLFKNADRIRVHNDETLKKIPFDAAKTADEIQLYTGYRDDPFIFPPFFQSNTVAMILIIPASCFPAGQQDWIVWATSSKNGRQVDHVGRSLRTQQPRFELLNTLAPKDQVAALKKENEDPSLMRDLGNKFTLPQLFAYRPWDFVPDLMIYSSRFNVGFPNGRRLTDDVSALLTRNGDTLLFELSYRGATWPRATKNDKPFADEFPFLAPPWPDREPTPGPALSAKNKMKIALILIGLAVVLALALAGAFFLLRWLILEIRLRKARTLRNPSS